MRALGIFLCVVAGLSSPSLLAGQVLQPTAMQPASCRGPRSPQCWNTWPRRARDDPSYELIR